MSVTLTLTPRKIIDVIDSNVASTSQLPYIFSRQDFAIVGMLDDGNGFLELRVDGDVSAQFAVGDTIYVGNPNYEKSGFITSFFYNGGLLTTDITLSLVFTVDTGGGYINLLSGTRSDYRLLVRFLDGTTVDPIFPVTFRYQTAPDGRMFLDARAVVVSLIFDLRRSQVFRMEYQEFYDDAQIGSAIIDDRVQAILSYRQIALQGGSNLWQYLPNLTPQGNILTLFDEPRHWRGWRRDVSLIRDDNFTTRTTFVNAGFVFTPADINKVLGTPVAGAITVNTTTIFTDQIPAESVMQDAAYVQAQITNSLSAPILYKAENECRNPAMISWTNSLGGTDQWLFEVNQEMVEGSTDGIIYNKPVTVDFENAIDQVGRTNAERTTSMTVTAENLTINELEALIEIKSSDFVFLMLTRDGTRNLRVRILNGLTTSYETKNYGKAYSFNLQVELPNDFNYKAAAAGQNFGELIDSDALELIDNDLGVLITS